MFQLLTNSALRSVFNKAASMQKTVNNTLLVADMNRGKATDKIIELKDTIEGLQSQLKNKQEELAVHSLQANNATSRKIALDDLIARFTAELEELNG